MCGSALLPGGARSWPTGVALPCGSWRLGCAQHRGSQPWRGGARPRAEPTPPPPPPRPGWDLGGGMGQEGGGGGGGGGRLAEEVLIVLIDVEL